MAVPGAQLPVVVPHAEASATLQLSVVPPLVQDQVVFVPSSLVGEAEAVPQQVPAPPLPHKLVPPSGRLQLAVVPLPLPAHVQVVFVPSSLVGEGEPGEQFPALEPHTPLTGETPSL